MFPKSGAPMETHHFPEPHLVYPSGSPVQADSHIACSSHAVALPCRAAKGLEYVFPI